MANPIGARKGGTFKAVSTAPSFNKTPVGSSTPPLPYPVVADLSNAIGVVSNVRFNGQPVYVLDQTTQPSCTGDAAGSAGGVKSGTVGGEVKPVKGATTVRVGGKPVIRQNDPCTMNGGNNPGIYVTTLVPSPEKATAIPSTVLPKQPEEQGFLDEALQALKDAAKYYQTNVSDSLHEAAGNAMDTGGKVALAGGATTLAGAGVTATGVGAPVGAVMITAGGATAVVGGAVEVTGSVAESVATALDGTAKYITSGQVPNLLVLATSYAERMVLKRVQKLIPGLGSKKTSGGKSSPPAKASSGSGNGKGVKVTGGGKKPGPCDHLKQGSGTGPYRGGAHSKTSQPTGDGKDSHHLPPKDASPLSEAEGPAIQMDKKPDHAKTSSNGQNGASSIAYRKMIKGLLKEGKWRTAMLKEIQDVRRVARELGNPRKYNEAMLEMLEYFKCLEKNGLLP